MDFKNFFQQFHVLAQCRKYGLSAWQCPQFLFFIMGIIIIVAMILTYQIGTRYIEEPEIIALIVMGVTMILFIIGFIITQGFERLAEASRMKSEFVSIVSHQLRSPLSNLKWAVELLMSGRLGKIEKKQTAYFKILKENSVRMAELVADLLVVSRLEQGTLPVKKEDISLERLINNIVKEFVPFARASNVEIKVKVQKELPEIFTDPSQLKIVIENLLDNAIRYIKDKGRVEIVLEQRGNALCFKIEDNGVGIPKEDQQYVFQKFFRSENVLRYQTQGSGLGLYITKSIIKRLGGRLKFKSEEGNGATFWFFLPIK